MARQPRVLPDGSDWVGKRVCYQPHASQQAERGTVTRMASGKALAMFVEFDGQGIPKYCYASDLEMVR